MKALLLSGGIDSTALAYWLRPDVALTINYGQVVADAECAAAKTIASNLNIRHETVKVDCALIAAGQMAGKASSKLSNAPEWWPYRNQLLITIAAAYLSERGLRELFIGSVSSDKIHHDGRPTFIRRMSRLLECQEGNVRVSAPAIRMTSAKLLKSTGVPESLLGWTFSCHLSQYPCGQCRGCIKRTAVLTEASDQKL